MLYRGNEPNVAEKIWDLANLIKWLETKDLDEEYDFYHDSECLLGQYVRFCGVHNYEIGGWECSLEGVTQEIPLAFGDIAVSEPRTFGEALSRAKKYPDRAKKYLQL